MSPIGPSTALRVSHSGLDANGNPETLAKAQARVVDGSSVQQGIVETAWSGSPTDVPLGDLLNQAAAGTYSLEYRVIDAAGNAGSWVVFGQVTFDGTAPADPSAVLV